MAAKFPARLYLSKISSNARVCPIPGCDGFIMHPSSWNMFRVEKGLVFEKRIR